VSPVISPAEAAAYRRRWQLVNKRQVAELRAMTIEQRFDVMCRLWQWARLFGGWERSPSEQAAIEEVRARWNRLRRIERAKTQSKASIGDLL
jgi:hypothetical protein